MPRPGELPDELGEVFRVAEALSLGVNAERMRRSDLRRPFPGLRGRGVRDEPVREGADDFARQAAQLRERAREYAPRLREGQFFSHQTAAALWGAPLPLVTVDGKPIHGATLPVHVSVFGAAPLPRVAGVAGHRARTQTSSVRRLGALPVASPATMWASLGMLSLYDLVAIGDFLCRVHRPGVGRRDVGIPPVATRAELAAAVSAGRRVGVRRLRRALELVREDAWSPRESRVRCILVENALPEPLLNLDVFDEEGRFLACLDLAYPDRRIAIEYHGILHSASYAKDVERVARLRAAGWTVIEVTAALLRDEDELVRRVRAALQARR